MMKKFKYLFLIYSITLSFAFANKIAVATKIKGLVEIMPVSKKDFSKLKPGTILSDGDKVRTGSKGVLAVIFIDDNKGEGLKVSD